MLHGRIFPLNLKGAVYKSCKASNIVWKLNVDAWSNETIDQLAMANWALDFKVEGQCNRGRPKRTWKKQVEEQSVMVGLRREDALCRSKWSVGINQIASGLT